MWPVDLTVGKTGTDSKLHLPTRPSRVLYGLSSGAFVRHVFPMPLTSNPTGIFIKEICIQTYVIYPKQMHGLESLDSAIPLILLTRGTDFPLSRNEVGFFPSRNQEVPILHRRSIRIQSRRSVAGETVRPSGGEFPKYLLQVIIVEEQLLSQ